MTNTKKYTLWWLLQASELGSGWSNLPATQFKRDEMSHKFTHEQAVAAGKKRASMPDFQEHQERAFEMLKAKRPDCWRWIYKNRVKPYMQGKK